MLFRSVTKANSSNSFVWTTANITSSKLCNPGRLVDFTKIDPATETYEDVYGVRMRRDRETVLREEFRSISIMGNSNEECGIVIYATIDTGEYGKARKMELSLADYVKINATAKSDLRIQIDKEQQIQKEKSAKPPAAQPPM